MFDPDQTERLPYDPGPVGPGFDERVRLAKAALPVLGREDLVQIFAFVFDEREINQKGIMDYISPYGVGSVKIGLVGSRANRTARKNSDWDILIVVEPVPLSTEEVEFRKQHGLPTQRETDVGTLNGSVASKIKSDLVDALNNEALPYQIDIFFASTQPDSSTCKHLDSFCSAIEFIDNEMSHQ